MDNETGNGTSTKADITVNRFLMETKADNSFTAIYGLPYIAGFQRTITCEGKTIFEVVV